MRTNIVIDDKLMADALRLTGLKTKREAVELEEVTLSWLRQWMGLPPEFFGIIHDTASSSTFHALGAAVAMRVAAAAGRYRLGACW